MMDLLLGDNDRHPDQWKWVRTGKKDEVPWEPIPRIATRPSSRTRGSFWIGASGKPEPHHLRPKYPDPSALFANAGEFDRRSLEPRQRRLGLGGDELDGRITDQVIDSAMREMPPEYRRRRRSACGQAQGAAEFAPRRGEQVLPRAVEGRGHPRHRCDDQATVVRSGEGIVDVRIQSGGNAPYFKRRFDVRETKEIRIYLHGGDDKATVEGMCGRASGADHRRERIPNRLVDLSTVGGKRNPTRFYDAGTVSDVKYAKDTVDENANSTTRSITIQPPTLAARLRNADPPQRDRGTRSVRYSGSTRSAASGFIRWSAPRSTSTVSATFRTRDVWADIALFDGEQSHAHPSRVRQAVRGIRRPPTCERLTCRSSRSWSSTASATIVPICVDRLYDVRQRQWEFDQRSDARSVR